MRIVPTVLTAAIGFFVCSTAFAINPPATLSVSGKDLARQKELLGGRDPAVTKMVKDLAKDADKALASPMYSVVNKPYSPPSGDKHDYMSLSPYWWPDPTKPDGKPYIRKDGQVNPEREKTDQPTLDRMTEAVQNLSLAYSSTGDELYAKKSPELIRVWF